jgi:hypoxanthine phosphoribosyltransferase
MKYLILFSLFLTSFLRADDNIELLISPEAISQKIKETAAKLDEQYKNEELTVIMVMKGAVCVAADLIRELNVPVSLEYMKASSYGKNGANPGELRLIGIEELDLTGKNVLVVDDIFDSGKTMSKIAEKLQEKKPKSLRTLVLVTKKIPRETSYRADYSLFEIGNRFVVGYGLDYKEQYRNLPGVYAFVNDTPPVALATKQ